MIRTAITGAKGKMGRELLSLVGSDPEMRLVAAVDVGDDLETSIDGVDIIIDFTSPDASVRHAVLAADNGRPIVIGTTGLDKDQEQSLWKASESTPVVYSPNMSVGVNLMLRLIRIAADAIGDDHAIDIRETHHTMKKDRPSGTALRMLSVVESSLKGARRIAKYEETLPLRDAGDRDIRICSVRSGDVVGDHEISFGSHGETLAISHHAASRVIFAEGAIRAAKWAIGRKPGLYSMSDVLFSDR